MSNRVDWVWDEIVLACDLVAANEWQTIPESDTQIQALSAFLRAQSEVDNRRRRGGVDLVEFPRAGQHAQAARSR
jgi:hypothetical protein